MNGASYLHTLDGRIRIKVPEVRRSPAKALQVEETLESLNGVTHVRANPTTGNVLVLFNSQSLTHECIIAALRGLNCLKPERLAAGVGHRISDVILRSVAELAFERMIVALL
jgi:hypothetical protein